MAETEFSELRRELLTVELRRVLAASGLDMLDVAGCIAEALSYEPDVVFASSGPASCEHPRPCGTCVVIRAGR